MELTIETKLALNDGQQIPQLGLGVWQTRAGATCEAAVLAALAAGYRPCGHCRKKDFEIWKNNPPNRAR